MTWRAVFELFHLRRPHGVTFDGVVTSLSSALPQCTVVDNDGYSHTCQLPWALHVPHLADVVAHCTCFRVRIVCVVESSSSSHVSPIRSTIDVDDDAFRDQMRIQRRVDGEVHVVNLLAHAWKDIVVLPDAHDSPFEHTIPADDSRVNRRSSDDKDHPDTVAIDALDDDRDNVPSTRNVLYPHQMRSIEWLRYHEHRIDTDTLAYEGNLKITSEWFVDTERECFTTDPSWRHVAVRGGILADWAGAGKTVTMLSHCLNNDGTLRRDAMPRASNNHDGQLRARGTLIIVPLNVFTQWQSEAANFFPEAAIVTMHSHREMRVTSMAVLLDTDVVLTTFEFLIKSRSYQDMVDDVVEAELGVERRLCRSRAAIAAWARSRGDSDYPILEAIHWRRIVIDEMHEAFARPKRVKMMRCFHADYVWGISATPFMNAENTADIGYCLLRRDKAHHPNLLHRLVHECTRRTRPPFDMPFHQTLRLVNASCEERESMRHSSAGDDDVEQIVKLCTQVTTTDDVEAWEPHILYARHAEDAERECEAVRREIANVRQQLGDRTGDAEALNASLMQLGRHMEDTEKRLEYVRSQIDRLASIESDMCSICQEDRCGVILPCGHTFCRPCISQHAQRNSSCPSCRRDMRIDDVRGIARVGTKMSTIVDVIVALHEPVILFVQWKSMMQKMRAVLRGRELRVYTLDGNGAQRRRSLDNFSDGGGVLLLSLSDSFAGLHLPHVRHIVFSHAVVGDDRQQVADIEAQAIARCLRIGQTRTVYAHSFVISETAEEDLWRGTHSPPDESST